MAGPRRYAHLLRHLVTFEAACRCESFTRAANELGISRVAVSRQIAELEAALGVTLFLRGRRLVFLTTTGKVLASAVNPALLAIARALDGQRRSRPGARLSLTVTSAFATYWLMPRLENFSGQHPEVEINIVVSDHYLDLSAEELDLAVRYMPRSLVSSDWRPLMREVIFPVYSRTYRARTGLSCAEDLRSERLLYLSGRYRAEARWPHWFKHCGLEAPEETTGIQVNTYINMLQAALEGQGVALAGYPLVDSYLQQGALLRVPNTIPLERDHYYVRNLRPEKPEAALFYKWLFDQTDSSAPLLDRSAL